MATHNHQLNFVMNLKTDRFAGDLNKIEGGVKTLKKALKLLADAGGVEEGKTPSDADNNAGKGGIISKLFVPKLMKKIPKDLKILAASGSLLGGVLGGLGVYVGAVGKRWFQWYEAIMETRKQMGLTFPETMKFGANVLSMTAKYGVAMDRVSSIATFVGQGTDVARNKVVELSSALAMMGDSAGVSDEKMAQFGDFLFKTLGLTEERAEATAAGLLGVSRETNVALEGMQDALMKGREAVNIASKAVGDEKAVQTFGALYAKMRQAGASAEDVDKVFAKLGDRNSRLFKIMAASNYDLGEFNKRLGNIREQVEKGALPAAALGEIWDGIGSIALEKMIAGTEDASDAMAAFTKVSKMDKEERRKWYMETLGPLDKMKYAWNEFFGDQTKAFNDLIGGPMARFGEFIGDLAIKSVEAFKDMTKWIGEKLYMAWAGLHKIATHFGIGLANLGEVWSYWKEVAKDAIGWVTDKLEWVWNKIMKMKAMVDDLTGKTAEQNRAAENKIPLINAHAKQLKSMEGLSNMEANMRARQHLLGRAKEDPSMLTDEERKIVFGPTGMPEPVPPSSSAVNIMPSSPASAAPGASKDPAVELMKEQLKALEKLNANQEEAMKRQDLERGRYQGSGGSSPGGSSNPMVETQRT